MAKVPGSAVNDLWGHALGRLAALSGARRRMLEGGRVAVYEGCAGPVGWFIRAVNGGQHAAVAVGHVILYTLDLDLTRAGDRWLLAHEMAHVAQAERMGILFLPAYSLGLLTTVLRWWRQGSARRQSLHDMHPMEVAANRAANAAVPEAARWV